MDLAPIYRSIYRYLELAWVEAPLRPVLQRTILIESTLAQLKGFSNVRIHDAYSISVAKRDDELREVWRQHCMYVYVYRNMGAQRIERKPLRDGYSELNFV